MEQDSLLGQQYVQDCWWIRAIFSCGYHGRALSQVRIPVVTVCLVMESDCDACKAGSLQSQAVEGNAALALSLMAGLCSAASGYGRGSQLYWRGKIPAQV